MKPVSLFIPCFVDQMAPEVGMDMARVLRRVGYDPQFPDQQTCCGQPAFNTGYWDEARPLAERFVKVFRSAEAVVCPSASCATMVRVFYLELLGKSALRAEAVALGRRIFEFSEFMVQVAGVTDVGAHFPYKVTYQDSCHALRELHIQQQPRELLRHVQGLELLEMPASTECCGFGGTFSVKFSMISTAMGDSKAGNAEASGADFVTSIDPSCLMQIDGLLRKRKSSLRTIHLASILARIETNTKSTRDAEARQ
jgi:L-lactate dehydrogenase complex protein LldE